MGGCQSGGIYKEVELAHGRFVISKVTTQSSWCVSDDWFVLHPERESVSFRWSFEEEGNLDPAKPWERVGGGGEVGWWWVWVWLCWC